MEVQRIERVLTGNCLDLQPLGDPQYPDSPTALVDPFSRSKDPVVSTITANAIGPLASADEASHALSSMMRDLVGVVNELRSEQRQIMSAMNEMKTELQKQGQEISRVRYTLETCEMCGGKPAEVHPCDNNPCYPGVICADNGEKFMCGECPPGFIGDGIRCDQHPTCNDRPCFEGML